MGMIQQVGICNVSRSRILQSLTQSALETAVPYSEFKKAGFEIDFVTEKGNMPECDRKMLEGMTQRLLVGYSMNFWTQGLSSYPLPVHIGCNARSC